MQTPIYPYHVKHAKITPFAGYSMPLFYTSPLQETKAVRERVGLFDVSHMGTIEVVGEDAGSFLEWVCTNSIQEKEEMSATYTLLASEKGGCIDDVMVMSLSKTRYLVVSNAINKESVFQHFTKESTAFKDVKVIPLFQQSGFLALQGKEVELSMRSFIPDAIHLKKHTLDSFSHPRFGSLIISRTGYTGEDGFEILAKNEDLLDVWEEILKNSQVMPCGLAARDILRLEMGYALYGHELSQDISPVESVSHWTVKWTKERFLGKESLLKKSQEKHRVEQGIILSSQGVMRDGFEVKKLGVRLGKITSGGFSPTLNCSVAIALLGEKQPIGQEVDIEIRGRFLRAHITKMPFVNPTT